MKTILESLLHAVRGADRSSGDFRRFVEGKATDTSPASGIREYAGPEPDNGELNELLIFTKPELFRPSFSMVQIEKILSLVLEKMDEFGLRIREGVVLTGRYLDAHDIIASHYGVIDQVTRDPLRFLDKKASETFHKLFRRTPVAFSRAARIIGGFEYLEQTGITPTELAEKVWLTREIRKVASGMYCVHVENEDIFLVNGFYPRMLRHFTKEESVIVGFVVETGTSWRSIRQDFLGATDPSKASAGSLRRTLLDRKRNFGLDVVSANFNGVHASAGPVEALVELVRFTSDMRPGGMVRKTSDFAFGRSLARRFDDNAIRRFLANARAAVKGKEASIFDFTEETDAADALTLLEGATFVDG